MYNNKLLKLLVIIILSFEMIFLPEPFLVDLFVFLNEFIISEIIMEGESCVKKLMKSKKASSIFYMEMLN